MLTRTHSPTLMWPVPALEGLLAVMAISFPHGVQLGGILPAALQCSTVFIPAAGHGTRRARHSSSPTLPKRLHILEVEAHLVCWLVLRCVSTGLYFYFLHTDGRDGKGIFDDDKRSKEKGRQQSGKLKSNTKKAMWENNLENTQRSEEQMTREWREYTRGD